MLVHDSNYYVWGFVPHGLYRQCTGSGIWNIVVIVVVEIQQQQELYCSASVASGASVKEWRMENRERRMEVQVPPVRGIT